MYPSATLPLYHVHYPHIVKKQGCAYFPVAGKKWLFKVAVRGGFSLSGLVSVVVVDDF